ncbi:MAG: FHA domain-containing protein [Verrucomicrobia bacterium]|nr:FHA domain-containing protein [Verrucomicrobiota bacterium]
MKVWLEESNRTRHPVAGVCSIGRSRENQIVIPAKSVSRRHAILFPEDDGFWLVDFGSRNGVYANGIRLHGPVRMHDGDRILLGNESVSFRCKGAPAFTDPVMDRATVNATEHLNQIYAPAAHGAVLLADDGGVVSMPAAVAAWFKVYFPEARAAAGRLPERLHRWVRAAGSPARSGSGPAADPLVCVSGKSRLIIRLTKAGAGQRLLLFTEERNAYDIDMLETLGLTRRQAEVLHWIAEGKTNAEIGSILSLSPRTTEKHTAEVFRKLGVENRMGALLAVVEKLGPAA